MIKEFVEIFINNQEKLKEIYRETKPENYIDIVKSTIKLISDNCNNVYLDLPDPENIIEINHGDYHGTFVYVIPSDNYQPNNYWYVKVEYGSCSHCDTLEEIHSQNYDEVPTEQQLKDYVTLSLHIVQRLKQME